MSEPKIVESRNKMKQDLRKRTKKFALRIIRLYSSLPKSTVAQVMGKQILRSGTSVGAHYREAYLKDEDGGMRTEKWMSSKKNLKPLRCLGENLISTRCLVSTNNTFNLTMFDSLFIPPRSSLIPHPSSLY